MADHLYLSAWFSSFEEETMAQRIHSVLQQFPFSVSRPGLRFLSVHAVNFSEPEVYEQSFREGATPEDVVPLAAQFLHSDYAYQFDAAWDLWVPVVEGDLDPTWKLQPQLVSFFVHGEDFEDGIYQENGHIQVDFGLDTPFLFEEQELSSELEQRVRANVHKLVSFTTAVEKNVGTASRVLWSESDDNLAQKLLARLQRLH